MWYLAGEDILEIHNEIIEKTGGAHGVRDIGLFLSAIERPRARYEGKELYPDIFHKAGAYFDSFAKHHVFVDGNKRTAFAATVRFLFVNGYEFTAGNKQVEIFTLRVVTRKPGVPVIAAWLRRNSRKIR